MLTSLNLWHDMLTWRGMLTCGNTHGTRNAYNMVSPNNHVVINHQNKLEQMAYEAIFSTPP
jgi:hypothetical protein